MRSVIALALVATAATAVLLPGQAAGAATKVVSVRDDFFDARSVTVKRGAAVRWVWRGRAPHNVVVTKGPQRFRSKLQTSGTYQRRLTRPGRYGYVCTIHAGMTGTIRVR